MSVLIDTQRYQMEMLSGNVIMLENNIPYRKTAFFCVSIITC